MTSATQKETFLTKKKRWIGEWGGGGKKTHLKQKQENE